VRSLPEGIPAKLKISPKEMKGWEIKMLENKCMP
jgi:hypothetical protein